jgi:hypothetical protein
MEKETLEKPQAMEKIEQHVRMLIVIGLINKIQTHNK